MLETLIIMVIKIGVVFGVLLLVAAYMTWIERKVIADIQVRWGPTRVGPFGLLQPIADGIKLFFKEDLIPGQVDRTLFLLAPALSVVPAMIAFAVIPFGGTTTLFGLLSHPVALQITDIDVGVLYVFGVTSLGVYGIVLAGWSSNNKYSLLGGLRSSAQLISYELAMTLAVLGVLLATGSLRLDDVVAYQAAHVWNFVPQVIGFVVFTTAVFAETNRLPFDLAEAETELVAGYHVEYSSMKFAAFLMSEYMNMTTASALIVTLFFGGRPLPGMHLLSGWWLLLASIAAFVVKLAFFLWLFVWVRWSLPRFRYDQLMRLGCKGLLPLATLNLVWVGVAMAMRWL